MEIDEFHKTNTKFIIGNFMNGVVKKKLAKKIKFGLFEQQQQNNLPVGSQKPNVKNKLLVGEVDGVRYTGYNDRRIVDIASTDLTRYMVGVHDKETGKIRLYDTEMFNMLPQCLDDADDEQQTEKSFFEKNDELTLAFGSSKKKKAMTARHKNKLKDSALQEVVGTAVDTALDNPDADKLIAPVEMQRAASDIPPYNADAVKPQDVYSLKTIISDAEMESMRNVAQEFVNSDKETIDEWEKQSKYPSYVINHLRVMPINDEPRLLRASTLLYLCYMIQMYKFTFKELKLKDPFPTDWNMPPIIRKQLFSMYTITPEGSRQRMMTARLKDKLLSYLLVLCLIIDEYNMPYSDLVKDLKIVDKKLQTFFRALGCKVVNRKIVGENVSMITLPIPIVFPDATKRARGGKQRM